MVSPPLYFPRRPALPPWRKMEGGRLLSVSEYSLSASSVSGSGLHGFFRHVIPSGLVLGPGLGDRMVPHPDTCLALCYFKGLILKRKKEKYVSVHLLNCALLISNTCSLLHVDAAHRRAREKGSLGTECGLQKVAQARQDLPGRNVFDCSKSKALCGFVALRDWCFFPSCVLPFLPDSPLRDLTHLRSQFRHGGGGGKVC